MSDILSEAYNQFLDYVRPLEPDDPRRVPLAESSVWGTGDSCVDVLGTSITMRGGPEPAYQLFSGFRGSGKSTELKLLGKNLAEKGYEVIYVDSARYLNLTEPTSITQVLIAIAAGMDSHLEAVAQASKAERLVRGFWERLHGLLTSRIAVEKATIGVPDVATLELSLKQDATFRQQLEDATQGRLPEFARECQGFMDEALASLKRLRPSSAGVVLIFDSFERLRGDLRSEEVWSSVEKVFVRDKEFLRIPCHAIYTVPPWMAFLEFAPGTGFDIVQVLPMCKIFDRESNQDDENGIGVMFQMLERRADLARLFAERYVSLRPLVTASGGYPRDLLRMISHLLVRMRIRNLAIPAPPAAVEPLVEEVIQEHARAYDNAICDEDIEFLAQVGRDRAISHFRRGDIHRIARLFDHHFILCYYNGEPWYDLHPLARQSPKLKSALQGPRKGLKSKSAPHKNG